MSQPVRQTFLDAARAASALVAHPAVAAAWDEPSALARMTVGDLAAHLARAGLLVEAYLEAPVGDGAPVDAADYFLAFGDLADVDSALSQGVRQRARDGAGQGHAAVAARMADTVDTLAHLLPGLPPDRRVSVRDGIVLSLDEYLKTRLVELAVHGDDLRVSVPAAAGDAPPVPEEARAVAVDVLVTIAVRRHGSLAVLRALARRERDQVSALRVF
jgi:hypothetical protein